MQRDSTRLALVAAGMALLFTIFAGTAAAATPADFGTVEGEDIYGWQEGSAKHFENSRENEFSVTAPDNTLSNKYDLAEPGQAWGTGAWPAADGAPAYPKASIFPWGYGEHNRVTIDGVQLTNTSYNGYVLGGLWQGRDHGANYNTVNIINGSKANQVFGGGAIGDAKGNTVYVIGGSGTTIARRVTGGMSIQMADSTKGQIRPPAYVVSDNKVYVSGAGGAVSISGTVAGGWNASGEDSSSGSSGEVDAADTAVIGNYVEINDGVTLYGTGVSSDSMALIYGGFNEGNSVTSGNVVNIKGGTINPTGDKTGNDDGARQIAGGYSSVITTMNKGHVFDNHVTISGGDITIMNTNANTHYYVGIYGGRSMGGSVEVNDNTVEITGGTIMLENGVVAGGIGGRNTNAMSSDAHDNAVTISGGNIKANVTGAKVNNKGTGHNNSVQMSGGEVAGNVYGAYDGTPNTATAQSNATITDNTVVITGGTVASGAANKNGEGHVYGGFAYAIDVDLNEVTISGGTVKDGNVYGGYTEDNGGHDAGDVINNAVTLAGGTVQNGDVFGGQTATGLAEWNRVTISAGAVENGDVFGGHATENGGEAKHNTVTIQGGTVGGSAYGSHATDTEVIGGVVNLTAGTVGGDAYGVYSGSGSVSAGEVNVAGGSVGGNAYGGFSGGDDTVNINGNTLSLTAGSIGGYAAGGASAGAGSVNANTLTITDGSVGGAYGGRSVGGAATGNILNLDGADIAGDAFGGWSDSGAAAGNKVGLRGADVGGNLYGGFATNSAAATANEVLLYGGTVKGTVFGNNNLDFDDPANWSGANNTLKAVSGRTDVGGVANFVTADIAGGAHVNVTGYKRNNVNHPDRAVFNDLANFGTLSFYNDAADQEIGTVHGAYTGAGKIGLDVVFNEGVAPTQTDSVVFKNLPAAQITFTFNPLPGSVMAAYTKSKSGGAPEDGDPNSLFAVSEAGSLTPFIRTEEPGYGLYLYEFREEEIPGSPGQFRHYVGFSDDQAPDLGKVVSDVGGAGVGSVGDMGSSFLMHGLDNAVRAIDVRDSYGISASIEYSGRRYDTGGRSGTADLDGASGLVTFAHAPAGCPFSVGVFGEFYDGEYETSDTVALPAVGATPAGIYSRRARGDILNYGGGVFFQYRQRLAEALATDDFAAWSRGLHLEATARFGRSVMDMDLDLQGYSGRTSFRDKGAAYYGASLGGGYVAKPTPDSAVDFYAHGMWVRLAGSSVYDENNSLGKHIVFDKADSLRVVAGARAAYTASDVFRPYVGLAADWEAMGRPGVFIDGVAARKADLSGLSGVLELGVGARLHERLFVDARVTGSVGKREGLAGLFEIRYEF